MTPLRRFALLVSLGLSLGVAHAQVWRCTDAAGKTVYADAPCPSGERATLVAPPRTPAQIEEERRAAEQARTRLAREQDAAREAQQAERAAAPPPSPPDRSQSSECLAAKKELDFVSSIRTLGDDEKRARMNAQIAAMNAACGTKMDLLPDPPPPPPPPRWRLQPLPPGPLQITHCDARYCYDAQGRRYPRAEVERQPR